MTHLSPMLGACLVVFVFLMLLEFFVLQPNSSSWLATKMWMNPCIIYITAPGWEKENVGLTCLLCLVFLRSPQPSSSCYQITGTSLLETRGALGVLHPRPSLRSVRPSCVFLPIKALNILLCCSFIVSCIPAVFVFVVSSMPCCFWIVCLDLK